MVYTNFISILTEYFRLNVRFVEIYRKIVLRISLGYCTWSAGKIPSVEMRYGTMGSKGIVIYNDEKRLGETPHSTGYTGMFPRYFFFSRRQLLQLNFHIMTKKDTNTNTFWSFAFLFRKVFHLIVMYFVVTEHLCFLLGVRQKKKLFYTHYEIRAHTHNLPEKCTFTCFPPSFYFTRMYSLTLRKYTGWCIEFSWDNALLYKGEKFSSYIFYLLK